MAEVSIKIKLEESNRPGGSTYLYSDYLPGFHFILGPGEDIQNTVGPALQQFLDLYLAAVQ
jgi:hypothetical protein